MNETATIANMAIAAIVGYTLGALPVAYIAGRIKGINVLEVGSRQAGATNVFREVSRKLGILVFLADSTKGLIAVLIGQALGLDSGYLLIPAVAAIMGHWNSPFTRFKGGDGVSTLTGIGIGLIGIAVLLPYVVVAVICLGGRSRFAHPSLWGAILGYITLMIIVFVPFGHANRVLTPDLNTVVVIGAICLGLAILVHSMVYHLRSRSWRNVEVPEAPPGGGLTDTRGDAREFDVPFCAAAGGDHSFQ